jgi:peptidoglycan hydrolase CwlO-like protein
LLSIDVSGELSGILGQLDDIYETMMDNQKMIEEIKEKILKLQFKKIDHE